MHHLSADPLAAVIASIGDDDFGVALTRYIRDTCGVDYCSAFRIGAQSLAAVSLSNPQDAMAAEHVRRYVHGQFWRRDEALLDARATVQRTGHAAIRMTPDEVGDRELRSTVYTSLVDRLLLCSHQPEGTFGVSLLRWEASPRFAAGEIDRLVASASVVMAMVGRHAHMRALPRSPLDALRSVADAEHCLAAMTTMPPREREVCARGVCGQSAQAIATELAIGAETVKSYRKRAGLRLGVATERDLLLAYLDLWSRWRDEGGNA